MAAKKIKKEEVDESEDYVKWTDENVKARSAFFANLNVEKIATDLKELSAPSSSQPSRKKTPAKPRNAEPRRTSLRLMTKPPISLNEEDIAAAVAVRILSPEEEQRRCRILEESIDARSCKRAEYTTDTDVDTIQNTLNALPTKAECNLDNQLAPASSTKFSVSKVVVSKVCKERAFSLALHSSESPVVVAVGDLDGGVGLHCESSSIGRCEFEPHDKRPVSSLAFDDCHLLSACYDGTLRCLDLNRIDLKFDLLYSCEDIGLTCVDVQCVNCHTNGNIWISHTDGTVARIDCRAGEKKVVGSYRVNPRHCRTISTNPAKHMVCTASRDGTVAFWDDRAMPTSDSSKKPLGTSIHSSSVSSAFLCPSDPFLALSTSYDNTVRISRLEGGDCKKVASLSHNNNTGRFLTPFRAVWHPVHSGLFGIGSLQRPRCVQLYTTTAKSAITNLTELCGDEIASVQSLVAFHRTLPLIVGVNSSSRIHSIYLNISSK